MRKVIYVLALIIFAITISMAQLAKSAWPMRGHDLQHTGRSPYSGPATVAQKWAFTGKASSSSPAIAADGTIYVGTGLGDNKLLAINPDGTQKWAFAADSVINCCPAIGADGTVYVGSTNNKLYAINPDGTQRWAYTTGTGITISSPAIGDDGTIYVGSADGKLYAIKSDGTLSWSFAAGDLIWSSPAIGTDGTIYIGSGKIAGIKEGKLYAINPDGTQRWVFSVGEFIESAPAIGADGTIYVGSFDNKLYAVNPDGTQRWAFTTGSVIQGSPAVATDGTIYIGSMATDNKLYAINPDGTQRWAFSTGGDVFSTPTIGADGTVYFGSYSNAIYAVNPDGTKRWSFMTGGWIMSNPAIGADGTLYVWSNDGKLYALGAGAQTPTITVTAPIGGEQWQVGTANNITWTSTGVTGNVKIELLKTGKVVSTLATSAANSGTYSWNIPTAQTIGTDYRVKVSSVADTTVTGQSAADFAITTSGTKPQTITVTTPNGTEQWQQGSTQNITWTSTGTPGNVKIDLYKNGVLNSIITASVANTGTYSWTISATQTIGTDYRVKISTVADAAITDTSNSNFAITATPTLGIPVQLSPSNNAVNVTAPVTIAWQAVNSAVNYEYELYGPASATVPVETNTVTTTTATIQYSVIAGTKYNWRVRAIDAKDVKSTYSPKWSFTMQALPTIGTPVLTFPLNNATGIALSPALTWQSAANATVYSVEVATNAGFTTPFVSTQNVTATTYSLTNLTNSTKYYWRVKGGDGTRWGTAATANFTTAAKQSISVPVLTSPANTATAVAISTALTWQAVNNAVSYTVQYATNSNFNNAVEVTATNLTTDVTMLVNTRYFWRVKATDADGNSSNWAPAWYFTTINQTVQLTAPTLIAPADGAVDVPANTTFTWTSVANALAYDVDISKDANFTTKVTLSSATTSLTKTLANSTVYYWRVRGKQGNNLGIWSTVNTFTTGALVPTFGVDAAISQSRPGSQLFGTGVINNTGDMQTVQLFQQINRQSEFYIVLTNTGNIPDNFLITTTSTVDSKWKVAVCDNGGIDRTVKVFGNGWISYTVKPGESTKLLMRFSAASKQIIDAANPPTLSIAITAKSYNDITNGSTTPASDTVVGTAILTKMSTIK